MTSEEKDEIRKLIRDAAPPKKDTVAEFAAEFYTEIKAKRNAHVPWKVIVSAIEPVKIIAAGTLRQAFERINPPPEDADEAKSAKPGRAPIKRNKRAEGAPAEADTSGAGAKNDAAVGSGAVALPVASSPDATVPDLFAPERDTVAAERNDWGSPQVDGAASGSGGAL